MHTPYCLRPEDGGAGDNGVRHGGTKKEVLAINDRVIIDAFSLKGSINLEGAILDDLVLLNYKESLEENSKYINLLSPDQTSNPYYVEMGWKTLSNNALNVEFPNLDTQWQPTSRLLTSSSPVILHWTNNDNITFKIHFEIDDDYMFQVNQEIENKSTKTIEVFPYRLIKRINRPDTINFFILHEGLISLLNDELLEKDYDDLSDDCSSALQNKGAFCDQKSTGGWLGFTDKYWMSALIPDRNEPINANYRHSNDVRDDFRAGYAGLVFTVHPNSTIVYKGKVFAGA